MTNTTKRCTKCDITKVVGEFYRNKSSRDGLYSQCKTCKNVAVAKRRTDNRGEYLARKREYTRERTAADPMFARLNRGATRARTLGNPVETFTSDDLLAYWRSVGIDPTRCFYTGELLGDDFHLDHMTPLSRGGAHAVWNLVPCAPEANNSKQGQTADEYTNREVAA
ncbi:HNH endonuclease domain-containing protein [Rhodococcus sp. A14]|uniref:HNH endonuclease domain-containing protein n=1 Tax=Rhodococcus sp. A14 TaxID=1194106 RepID=UPI001421C649|nr:hypothetical protein [Rhodococcus sp. A14]